MICGIYKDNHIIHANHLQVLQIRQEHGYKDAESDEELRNTTTASFSQATIAAIGGSQSRACSETDVQTAQ